MTSLPGYHGNDVMRLPTMFLPEFPFHHPAVAAGSGNRESSLGVGNLASTEAIERNPSCAEECVEYSW